MSRCYHQDDPILYPLATTECETLKNCKKVYSGWNVYEIFRQALLASSTASFHSVEVIPGISLAEYESTGFRRYHVLDAMA